MEFFVEPGTDEDWHQYWINARTQWYIDLGVNPENLRHYEHPKEKLAHYSKRTVDIEYRFGLRAPIGVSSRAWPTAPISISAPTPSIPVRT